MLRANVVNQQKSKIFDKLLGYMGESKRRNIKETPDFSSKLFHLRPQCKTLVQYRSKVPK